MLIGEGTGSPQAESSKLKAKKGTIPCTYFQLSALSFQAKLQRLAHLIHEIVKEKISKLELLPRNGRFVIQKESTINEIS